MSNKVNRKDKDSLIVIGVLVAMILLIVSFSYFTKLIPFRYIAYGLAALEIIVLMPIVCRKYYIIKTGSAPLFCYVPGINILQLCLNKGYVLLFCTTTAVTVFLGLCVFLPYSVKVPILGESLAYNLSYNAIGYLILAVIVFSVVVGLIYVSVQKDVLYMVCSVSNTSIPASEYIFMILAFIPLVRCLFLSMLSQHLTKLAMNGYKDFETEEDYDTVEEEL